MGTAERKAKEKEELKHLILEGAKKLFVEKGIEHTTIRNIANEINYSVGTVYVYYKDKNDILHALHMQGFSMLGSRFKVLFSVENPMERLKAMGKEYIRFALENPEMYDLMFNLRAPIEFLDAMKAEEWNEGRATFFILKNTVIACMEQGHFKGLNDAEAVSFMIWSTVHGMCSLEIRDRCKGVAFENPETIVERGYAVMLKMIDSF